MCASLNYYTFLGYTQQQRGSSSSSRSRSSTTSEQHTSPPHTHIYIYFSHAITTCAHNYLQFTSECHAIVHSFTLVCVPMILLPDYYDYYTFLIFIYSFISFRCHLPACLSVWCPYMHAHTFMTSCGDEFMIWHCLEQQKRRRRRKKARSQLTHIPGRVVWNVELKTEIA